MAELREIPRSCKSQPPGQVPVVDRNRCEAKDDCVRVCPYDVFEVRVLTPEERAGVSIRGRVNLLVHRNRQAVVIRPSDCHACGCASPHVPNARSGSPRARRDAGPRVAVTRIVNSCVLIRALAGSNARGGDGDRAGARCGERV